VLIKVLARLPSIIGLRSDKPATGTSIQVAWCYIKFITLSISLYWNKFIPFEATLTNSMNYQLPPSLLSNDAGIVLLTFVLVFGLPVLNLLILYIGKDDSFIMTSITVQIEHIIISSNELSMS